MAKRVIKLTDIVSTDWRYSPNLGDTLRRLFTFSVSGFNGISSVLFDKRYGIRLVNKNILIRRIHEVSSLRIDPVDEGWKISNHDTGELNVLFDDTVPPEQNLDAITFYYNYNSKKVIFAIWLLDSKRLIMRNNPGNEYIVESRILKLCSSFTEYFYSDEHIKEVEKEAKRINKDFLDGSVFSIGGDPEFELLNAATVHENIFPNIVSARKMGIVSTSPDATIGADGSGSQVELRPEAVTFGINDDPEEVANMFIEKTSNVLSRYASIYNHNISAYGQFYSLGHHIHLGSAYKLLPDQSFLYLLDRLIGQPLGKLNTNPRISSRYNKLSAYETKSYGFEYRTPTGVWSHPILTKFVVKIIVKAIQTIATTGLEFDNYYDTLNTLLKKLGFSDDFIAQYVNYIDYFEPAHTRVDVLGNWAIRKEFPVASYRFPFDVRSILLNTRNDKFKIVFLTNKTNSIVVVTEPLFAKLISKQLEPLASKYSVSFKILSDAEIPLDLAEQEITEPSTSGPTDTNSSSNVSLHTYIKGLTYFILPKNLSIDFYSEFAKACETLSYD